MVDLSFHRRDKASNAVDRFNGTPMSSDVGVQAKNHEKEHCSRAALGAKQEFIDDGVVYCGAAVTSGNRGRKLKIMSFLRFHWHGEDAY